MPPKWRTRVTSKSKVGKSWEEKNKKELPPNAIICNKCRCGLKSTFVPKVPTLVPEDHSDDDMTSTVKHNTPFLLTTSSKKCCIVCNKIVKSQVVDANVDSLEDFPVLTEDDVRQLTFGVYQVNQAKRYTDEHLQVDGKYTIMVMKEANGLICIKIQSRFVSSKTHYTWVEYNPDPNVRNSIDAITGWYCSCPIGSRVVGSCAHVACAIWYLGCGRHEGYVNKRKCTEFDILNSKDMPEMISSEDDDSS